MLRTINELWTNEEGAVLSTEMMLYGTVGVVGATTGLTAFRDAVNSELGDLSRAIGALDQSYCISPVTGHHAYSAGSAYYDRADYCDIPQLKYVQPTVQAPVGRPLVCADVFGPTANPSNGPGPVPTSRALPPGVSVPGSVPGNVQQIVVGGGGSKGVSVAPVADPLTSPGYARPHGHNEPWLVDVPEGYFNTPPTGYVGPVSQFPQWLNRGNFPCNGCGTSNVHGGGSYVAPLPADAVLVAPPVAVHYAPAIVTAEPHWNAIELGFAKVGDEELQYVEKFKTAKCLHVIGSNVTDKGVAYIAQLQQLESVHLIGTQITDAGLKEIGKLKNLRFLHLVGTQITDAGLKNLASLKNLQELDVRGTPVTETGLAELSKALPTLKVVR